MKITVKDNQKKTNFDDLKVGDIFVGGYSKTIYMKLKMDRTKEDNVVDLQTGDLIWFQYDTMGLVIPKEAKLEVII